MLFSRPFTFLTSPPGMVIFSPIQPHEMMQHVGNEQQGISPAGQLCVSEAESLEDDPTRRLSYDSEADPDSEAGTDDGAVDDIPSRTLNLQKAVVTQADSLKKALFSGLLQEFGHTKFRDGQLPALLAIDKGRDCVVTLPTGGGKSLLYQLFSISREKGVCLTICPTIAIMEQQSAHRVAKGVYVNGEWKNHTDDILTGKYKVLYLAPEWLSTNKGGEKPAFDEYKLGFLVEVEKKCGINLITIDESHLTLNWSKCPLFLPRWLTNSPCSSQPQQQTISDRRLTFFHSCELVWESTHHSCCSVAAPNLRRRSQIIFGWKCPAVRSTSAPAPTSLSRSGTKKGHFPEPWAPFSTIYKKNQQWFIVTALQRPGNSRHTFTRTVQAILPRNLILTNSALVCRRQDWALPRSEAYGQEGS